MGTYKRKSRSKGFYTKPVPQKRAGYYCQTCDKLMSAWWTRTKYCCAECRRIGVNKKRAKVFTCVVCEKVWEPVNRKTQNRNKTCSSRCRSTLISWINTGRRHASPVRMTTCPICSVPMPTRFPNRMPRMTCSRKCGSIYSWKFLARKKDVTRPKGDKGRFVSSSCKP